MLRQRRRVGEKDGEKGTERETAVAE